MAQRRKKKRENDGLRLTNKRHPGIAILSTVLGIVSFVFFAVLCVISGKTGGMAGIEIGLLGLVSFAISIAGFILACLSLRLEEIRPLFPTLGAVINGLLMLMYLIVYILGTG